MKNDQILLQKIDNPNVWVRDIGRYKRELENKDKRIEREEIRISALEEINTFFLWFRK